MLHTLKKILIVASIMAVMPQAHGMSKTGRPVKPAAAIPAKFKKQPSSASLAKKPLPTPPTKAKVAVAGCGLPVPQKEIAELGQTGKMNGELNVLMGIVAQDKPVNDVAKQARAQALKTLQELNTSLHAIAAKLANHQPSAQDLAELNHIAAGAKAAVAPGSIKNYANKKLSAALIQFANNIALSARNCRGYYP